MCPRVQFLTNCAGLITTQRRVLNQSRKRTASLRVNSVKLLYMADGGTTEQTPLSTAVPSLIKCKKEHLKEEAHKEMMEKLWAY